MHAVIQERIFVCCIVLLYLFFPAYFDPATYFNNFIKVRKRERVAVTLCYFPFIYASKLGCVRNFLNFSVFLFQTHVITVVHIGLSHHHRLTNNTQK